MLKLTAALLMVLDHFALVFLPSHTIIYLICRLIGRLSMPLFAYQLAKGYCSTKNFKKYLSRVGLMTLATQVPFTWLIYGDTFWSSLFETKGGILLNYWNIGLTFLCALLFLKYAEQLLLKPSNHWYTNLFYSLLLLFIFMASSRGDYGIYGLMMVVGFYLYHHYNWHMVAGGIYLLLLTVAYAMGNGTLYFWSSLILQGPAIFSILLIRYLPDYKLKLPKYFFYWFYPVHMLILLLLHQIF